jgi:transcriptional regulator NrdR family protein
MTQYQNLRFRCICGAQLDKVSNSRNRTGTARVRSYKCSKCGETTSTVEVIVDDDLRNGVTGESVLRRHVLESASPKELIDALKFHLLGNEHD